MSRKVNWKQNILDNFTDWDYINYAKEIDYNAQDGVVMIIEYVEKLEMRIEKLEKVNRSFYKQLELDINE